MARKTAAAISQSFQELNLVETLDTFILISKGSERIAVQRELLRRCEYFQNLFNSNPGLTSHTMETVHEVLVLFVNYLKRQAVKKWPDGFLMLRFAVKLQQADFTKWCVLNVREFEIPADCSEDEVISAVCEIVRLHPLRQAKDYRPLVDAIELWAANDQGIRNRVLAHISTVISQKVDSKTVLAQVPLFCHEVTVALMEIGPRRPLQLAWYKPDLPKKWVSFDPLGPNFEPSTWTDVNNFHIVPFTYIVYLKSDGCIYFKDLKTTSPAQVLLQSCRIFRSILGELIVVCRTETGGEAVHKWATSTSSFKQIFSHPDIEIKNVSVKHYGGSNYSLILTTTDVVACYDYNTPFHFETGRYDDYVVDMCGNEWIKASNASGYRCKKTLEELPCGEAHTHMGFEKLTVRPLCARMDLFETENIEGDSSYPHGRVVCISDMLVSNPSADI